MRAYVAAGWHVHHLTDRVVELRKDSYEYRRLTGRDGFVRLRAETGMDRAGLVERAVEMARETDEKLSFRVAAELIPTATALHRYRDQLRRLAPRFGTPEDPELIGVKRA